METTAARGFGALRTRLAGCHPPTCAASSQCGSSGSVAMKGVTVTPSYTLSRPSTLAVSSSHSVSAFMRRWLCTWCASPRRNPQVKDGKAWPCSQGAEVRTRRRQQQGEAPSRDGARLRAPAPGRSEQAQAHVMRPPHHRSPFPPIRCGQEDTCRRPRRAGKRRPAAPPPCAPPAPPPGAAQLLTAPCC